MTTQRLSLFLSIVRKTRGRSNYIRFEEPSCEIVPVGCVLTMVGTGSEMNGGAVITNHEQKLKIGHVFGDNVMPKFAILNPKYTYTLPKRQMVAGIYDIFNHICEQYFSGEDDNTSDYISEALMKSVIHSSRIALQNPEDYEARSNIMWTATWALNTLIAKGKSTDWMVHMLGQSVGAYTDATHGMTLSAVSLPYYRYISSVPVAMMVHPANLLFVQYVGDGESVLFVFLVHARYGRTEYEVRLRGLDPDSLYTYESGDRQKERSGQFLMKRGIRIQLRGDYDSRMIVFRQKKNS